MLTIVVITVFLCSGQGSVLKSRILGGDDAKPQQFPFIASIRQPVHLCDGVILSNQAILTAAHCLSYLNSGATVLVGTHTRYSGGEKHRIHGWVSHDDFKKQRLEGEGDIGIIRLADKLEFSEAVQPIALGNATLGSTCIAAGRGWTEKEQNPSFVKFINASVIHNVECKAFTVLANKRYYIGPKTVCTLAPSGQGLCHGDSGGPLICDGKLVGIAAYTVMLCADGYPDVYSRISAYSDWIQMVLDYFDELERHEKTRSTTAEYEYYEF